MSRQPSHHLSIDASIDDCNDADGIFRSPNDLRSVGASGNLRSPSLPVSLSRRWWFNFRGYVSPGEFAYDSSFRRHKQKSRFLLALFSSLILIAILITLLYEGGEQIADAISVVVPHQAYAIAQQMSIPEIQAEMVLYRHKKTQAEVLTIIPSDLDQDVVFGLSVKTLATDNKGVGHVLMHSLWDGSSKYPLKDQVHTYHKGSLATLVDATCLEDRTLYTVASRNRKDLSNLMSIALDALFQPLVRIEQYGDVIFREEGWRLDPVDGKNFSGSNENLRFKGQTLNLQKAAYNDVDEMITRYARRALFGNTNYQFDAQGVPTDIIDLRMVDVTNFYDRHYVATNTQVFVYGSVESVNDALQAFDDSAKEQKAHLDIMEQSLPQWQPFNLKEVAEEIHAYPIQQGDNEESHAMVSWLMNDSHLSHKTQFAWLVLEHLLMGTPISILRRNLEEIVQTDVVNATISTEVIGGLDTNYQQWTFSAGIKGIARDQVAFVQNRIDLVLGSIVSFDSNAIAAAMNVVEMRRRDLSSGSQPRGVLIFRQALTEWNYNREPKDSLAWSVGFQELKDEIAKNGDALLIALLQEKLVHNNHRVRIRLDPSLTELSKQRSSEAKRMILMRQTMSEQEFQKVLDESKARHERQTSPVDDAIYNMLPKLELSDIPTQNVQQQSHYSIDHQILYVETPVVSSFGMLFVDFGVDIRAVEYANIALLPVVYRLMLQSGTQIFDSNQLIYQIEKYSTGIAAESMILDVRPKEYNGPLQFSVHDGVHLATKVFFRGRCMAENLPLYLQILTEIIFHGLDFQKDLVLDVLNDVIDEMESEVASSGDRLVASRLAARYSYHGLIKEQLAGMHQLQSLHAFLLAATSDWDAFVSRLDQVRFGIMQSHRNGMILSVTGELDLLTSARPVVEEFLSDGIPRTEDTFPSSNPGLDPHVWIADMELTRKEIAPFADECLILATTANYVGEGGRVYLPGVPVNGGAAVAAKYLQRVYLYTKLHDNGGAANVFVDLSFRHGTLLLISYKDPSWSFTLDAFDNAATSLQRFFNNSGFSNDAQAAIVGTIADLDGSAKQPDEIGWDAVVYFLQDDNADFAQLWRNQILKAGLQDFLDFFQAVSQWISPSVAVVSDSESYLTMTNATNKSFVKVCPNTAC